MKIIGAAECCGSAASKPGQAHVAAAPSSTQAPAMGVLKKPASKLQGILKKPATSRDLALVPYQAAQEEPEDEEAEQDDLQEEDEEEVQEQPQEEAEEEEEEEGPSKPFRTTTSSSRRPRTFRRKTSTTSSTSSTRSRSSACGRSLRRAARPTQEPSKPSRTALAQAQARLPGRGACSGGGSSMVESSVEFSCTRSSGLQASWLSYKETCDKIGEEELKARVAAGTIQHRKNPEDRRFFQFKLHKAWCCAKFITADSGESCRFILSGNRRHHHLPQNWLQGPGQSGRHPPGHRFLRQPQGGTLR